jgi:endonuclease/exonuclease/phosphatase family metal-dependent hydrolase
MIAMIFVFILLSVVIFLLWASRPWSLHEQTQLGEVLYLEPDLMVDTEEFPSVIKIVTWNTGFLYGEGSDGTSYQKKDESFYRAKLNEFVSKVKEWNPDILCLQEVDFEASRTHFIDQARTIAKEAGYPYVAEGVSWDANYIPFPYWPLSRQFGKMKSGGAILSRYPILDHQIQLLQKPLTNAWFYNLFYIHRYFQKVTIQVGEKKYRFINLHLEAYDKEDRKTQIQRLIEIVNLEKTDFVTGDFNMIPKSATKRTKFDTPVDYDIDPSYELMSNSGLSEVVPDDIYAKDEALYFTFPSSKPDRRLDYIFFRKGLKMMKAEVLSSNVSDHLPLKATFQIDSPRYNPFEL